jgi:hypothetical protein
LSEHLTPFSNRIRSSIMPHLAGNALNRVWFARDHDGGAVATAEPDHGRRQFGLRSTGDDYQSSTSGSAAEILKSGDER